MNENFKTCEAMADPRVFRVIRTSGQIECVVAGFGCQPGDTLYVREFDGHHSAYTGMTAKRIVDTVTRDDNGELVVTLLRGDAADSFFASPELWQPFRRSGTVSSRELAGRLTPA
jgi:hypothetical protein